MKQTGIIWRNYFEKGLVLLLVSMILTACENSFEPLKENDQYYHSVFGTLDATADTQWVRVNPVRTNIYTDPEIARSTVRLTHEATGETVTLNDSLFQVRENYFTRIYWTTMDIQPGENYLFEAVDSEQNSSTVRVEVPADFPTPMVRHESQNPLSRIEIENVERVVVADIIYFFRIVNNGEVLPEIHSQSYSIKKDLRVGADPNQKVILTYPQAGFSELTDSYTYDGVGVELDHMEVRIVSGGPGWPDTEGLTEEEKLLPGAVSNVVNGLGTLAGIVSKRLPMETCYDPQGEWIACPEIEPPYQKFIH